jgi:AraC-like DNA-binding protein
MEMVSTPQMTSSSISMDPTTQEQGKELQEVMRLFRETTTTTLSSFVLQTPLHKNKVLTPAKENSPKERLRESPRLKAKGNKDKSITRLAQDLVANQCRVL